MSFDLERFKFNKAERHIKAPGSKKKWQRKFVKVPWSWIEKLTFSNSANTYRLALHLLYEHWKGNGPIKVSNNAAVSEASITRHAKRRALLELETLGLIQVERHPRRSPLVTIIIES
jgi:hypothetical protein